MKCILPISDIRSSKKNFSLNNFSPKNISGIHTWFDASDLSTINTSTSAPDVDSLTDKINGFVFSQSTASKKPHSGINTISGKNVITFDGVDDLLVNTSNVSNYNGTSGSFFAVVNFSSVTQPEYIFSGGNTVAPSTYYLLLGVTNGTPNLMRYGQKSGLVDIAIALGGSTPIETNVTYLLVFTSSGTVLVLNMNDNQETIQIVSGSNNGDWFGDTSNLNNITIGAHKTTDERRHFAGHFCESVYLQNSNPSELEYHQLINYFYNRWGIDHAA